MSRISFLELVLQSLGVSESCLGPCSHFALTMSRRLSRLMVDPTSPPGFLRSLVWIGPRCVSRRMIWKTSPPFPSWPAPLLSSSSLDTSYFSIFRLYEQFRRYFGILSAKSAVFLFPKESPGEFSQAPDLLNIADDAVRSYLDF